MNIKKITILVRKGFVDSIFVYTDLPTTFPQVSDDDMIMKFEAQKGTGKKYVIDNFGIEPEIIDAG